MLLHKSFSIDASKKTQSIVEKWQLKFQFVRSQNNKNREKVTQEHQTEHRWEVEFEYKKLENVIGNNHI